MDIQQQGPHFNSTHELICINTHSAVLLGLPVLLLSPYAGSTL